MNIKTTSSSGEHTHTYEVTPPTDLSGIQAQITVLASRVTALEPSKVHVVPFTPTDTIATLLALLADESVDVIELNGTYHLPGTFIDIDRTRPVVVRPATGATVVFSGANIDYRFQFWFGYYGIAGNITMQGFIFDGYVLGQQGIITAVNCHDITVNDMVVRNSRSAGTASSPTALPYHSWAVYLSSVGTAHSTNFTANRWTVLASARGMSALAVQGGSHITASGWSVTGACYAVYAANERGPLIDLILSDWTISNSGAGDAPYVSVSFAGVSGRFSNIHAMGSGVLRNTGTPLIADGGGNTWA